MHIRLCICGLALSSLAMMAQDIMGIDYCDKVQSRLETMPLSMGVSKGASEIEDFKSQFANPPKGYGNVPFYWWNGDTLRRERLLDQLDIMEGAAIDGFSVSYIHTHPKVDIAANAHGYGSFGKDDPGVPAVFSEDWWSLWQWFSSECASRGLAVGLDDYVIGWPGNGYYPDVVKDDVRFKEYPGKLVLVDDSIVVRPSCLLHPDYGKVIVENYFDQFEHHLDSVSIKGMNYFFQDELQYPLVLQSWCADMPQQFKDRKDYDIEPYLTALFKDIGPITPKIRLDYADVLRQLAQERYFGPIYDWHAQRGLIYGCDNNGRGKEPTQYVDYFNAISNFTAPGNDAPARGSSFMQTKVSSSIAHVNNRPRTWLEAFHSMGWDSNGRWLTHQLDHHLIAGGNLLCMHGLYYTTHGGWWEWAPPCFHFRMPYWPHMKHWLRYAQRMCYALSQGHHVCDIAVAYPTETAQAYPGTRLDDVWSFSEALSNRGVDYDFADHVSLSGATIENGSLRIGNEAYRILIIPYAKALQHTTLLKALEFQKQGGKVIFVGSQPIASSLKGEKSPELEALNHRLIDNGASLVNDIDDVMNVINSTLTPDFKSQSGNGKVLHRKIDGLDLYMVMDLAKDEKFFIRSKGNVELLDAFTGKSRSVALDSLESEGEWLKFHGLEGQSCLYIVTPCDEDSIYVALDSECGEFEEETVLIHGEWTIQYAPTMDNKWGDYRLPASAEIIGVEAREMECEFTDMNGHVIAKINNIYGYGPHMECRINGGDWQPYCYSWQYGVFDNPGSQGYHGLKGKVDNRFLILDHEGSMDFRTNFYCAKPDSIKFVIEGVSPDCKYVDGRLVTDSLFYIGSGWHRLELSYANTKEGKSAHFASQSNYLDPRNRSAVMLYHSDARIPGPRSSYDDIVAMKWFETDFLPYDAYGGIDGVWKYKFASAPGARNYAYSLHGQILSEEIGDTVCVVAKPDIGYPGAAIFAEPVKIECSEAEMPLGNWSEMGSLKYYSGGIRYRKAINIPNIDSESVVKLDLGEVDATCEVKINRQPAGILLSPPYSLDISQFVTGPDIEVEVLVYSSLSNHYQTIPSAYRGEPHSGLMGPVKIVLKHGISVVSDNRLVRVRN